MIVLELFYLPIIRTERRGGKSFGIKQLAHHKIFKRVAKGNRFLHPLRNQGNSFAGNKGTGRIKLLVFSGYFKVDLFFAECGQPVTGVVES